jgi:outer membrane protein OmpA-like peptidoglycan-associated protein
VRLAARIVLALLLAASLGCAEKKVALRMAVDVTSDPAGAELKLRGESLGTAPRTVNLETYADLAALVAVRGNLETVEKRVRILSPEKAEVVFRLGSDGPSPLARRLGLTRILVFEYAESVSFDSAQSTLRPESFPVLDKQAEILNVYFPGTVATVCGFTDSTGSDDLNDRLSLARADAVVTYLSGRGVAPARLKGRGFAKEFPIAPNDTPEGRARNRRTEVVLPD